MSLLCVLFLPLLSAIFAGIYSFSPKNKVIGYFCSYLMLLACIFAFISLYYLADKNLYISLGHWIGILNVNFGFLIDSVSLTMMCVVTLVATCVHFYSIYYMEHDEGFNKFFAFLGLFVFCMLILVMSDNFLLLFVGWEGVGLCSWLLIGFWYQNEKFSLAANEAFIMNRISDFAMLLGIFLIYFNFGTLSYKEVFAILSFHEMLNPNLLTLIAALLFVGAMGKSAQFPFHTWLANAMAGPTPVSALIHAATMVTAGVYLVIRSHDLFSQVPNVSYFIACLGAFVALFAASMAIAAKDLKRIVAFSTLSQLGYMFVACGLGAYKIALFHLVTHAFFKALLFLGAGNIMHAMHDELNIYKMGKLYKPMKVTAVLMIIASLALSGIYPFAGFFSKDKILDFAFVTEHFGLYSVLLFTAFLTAFYSFRLLMMVFFAPKNHTIHPHEAKPIALIAMLPLAILAIIAGFWDSKFFEFIRIPMQELHHNYVLIAISLVVAIVGIVLAIVVYKNGAKETCNCKYKKLLENEYYIPKLYEIIFIQPYKCLAKVLTGFEEGLYSFIFECPKKLLSLVSCENKNNNLTLHIVFICAFCVFLLLTMVVIYA
ncbi:MULTISPECIES: NADH-quinone oxidoreductase subunit L [unclassified Campylobacter]|uniref:NADH-quinone oxidoreductase subunit L n=1 Tax=Campylobacter sp. RM12651 TaxID=1660079 RepID=UPI001D7623C7|nr:NADH-quinone oxidoreductase subunit L [Campylobacter sp. RM12651]MBZ7976379.1 NADH-quinone oxidoreductase subunit L [Campylobacter sp. RM12637]MBZ7983845.1 NADH-quinone oxidoreductase subunit L [Campylobacter sp. RM12647]MBZ7992796.1 NADH-quinone oxidoreductase subunit L [Campylobacter sp. RM9333]ULO02688.1 NADH:quinone oxidoreductase I, membrane subunit L [Campylobacter sp. RM12651]